MIWISLFLIILVVVALLWVLEEASKSRTQQARSTLTTNVSTENLNKQKKQNMETEETDHIKIILLAELPPRDQDTEKHPVQVQYSLERDKGAFYYQNNILRSTKFVQKKCLVLNSGTKDYKDELHDQEELPLKNLLELIELTKKGSVFHFKFDPVREVWCGNLEHVLSGTMYNTSIYVSWKITLVLDLIHYTYEYDSFNYDSE
jgi:hypothetical protein